MVNDAVDLTELSSEKVAYPFERLVRLLNFFGALD